MDLNFSVGREYPAWLDRSEFPFKSNYFKTPNGMMHYIDEGKGNPVVMVHGNPGWSFIFRKVVSAVSGSCRCIAPDHIGFGLSDKPYEFNYLPENQAKNFELFMDSLELSGITLIVNDWGGPIGLSYALKYPEKIKKLIILNTWLWSVEKDWYYKMFSGFMGGPVGRYLIRNYNFFGKVVVKKAVADPGKLTKSVHRHYYEHLATKEDRKGCYVFPKQIIGSSKWLDSLWQQKERINSIPTKFIWGMKDIAFREKELNYFVSNWHNPKVIKLQDSGHYPAEESPGALIEELLHQNI